MATFYIGQVATAELEFRKVSDKSLVNPAAVNILVIDPQDEIETFEFGTDPEITNPSTGRFLIDVPLSKPGEYTVRGEGLTTNVAAIDQSILVRESRFYNADGSRIPDTP